MGFSLSQGHAQYEEVASRRISGIITLSDDSVVLHMNRERCAELANFDIGIGLANREMTRGYLVRLHIAAKVLPTGNDYAEALSKMLDKEYGVELTGEAITKEIAPAYDTWRTLQRMISRNDSAAWAYDSHVHGAAITLVDAYTPRDLLVDGMKVGVRAYQALQSLRTRIVDTISHAMQLSAPQRNVLYELRSDAAVTKAVSKNALAFNFFDKLPRHWHWHYKALALQGIGIARHWHWHCTTRHWHWHCKALHYKALALHYKALALHYKALALHYKALRCWRPKPWRLLLSPHVVLLHRGEGVGTSFGRRDSNSVV